jgi:hypothetical protein
MVFSWQIFRLEEVPSEMAHTTPMFCSYISEKKPFLSGISSPQSSRKYSAILIS